MKLHTFEVPETADGRRLLGVACRILPQLPEYRLREAFAKRDVKQNGVRVGKEALAIANATVAIYMPESAQAPSPAFVYEDPNIIIVRKPAGISCDVDDRGGPTVGQWLTAACPGRFATAPMPCHRLDNQTDGLLMLALDAQTLADMQLAFRRREVHKHYECLVKGVPSPAEAVLNAYLRKDAQAARVTVLDHPAPDAAPICTGYRVLEVGEVSRLQVELFTGRTHQIRAQMAHIGHPLLGDDRYGDRAFNKAHKARRLMLTATDLRFTLTGRMAYLNALEFHIRPQF